MTGMIKYEPQASGALDVMTLGRVLADSGYFQDARDAAQAIVKVLAGQEMGIGSIAAMTGIYIVKGRVTLSANLMAAQIKRSGKYNYRVARLDDTGCEIIFYEGSQEIGRSAFNQDDAKTAGLLSQDNYKKTPRNMYFARAMSNGAKWYTPDVFSGPVYTPDELESAPIDVTPIQRPVAPVADVVTGEVVEQTEEPAMPIAAGSVSDPKAAFNSKGDLWITFGVNDLTITAKGADFPDLAHLEAGDFVKATYTPTKNKGKTINLLVAIEGDRDADGVTPWEERALETADEGATFTPQGEPNF